MSSGFFSQDQCAIWKRDVQKYLLHAHSFARSGTLPRWRCNLEIHQFSETYTAIQYGLVLHNVDEDMHFQPYGKADGKPES